MGNYEVSRTYIYVAGNVIEPSQNNTNENTIYSGHNSAFNASTGHTHSGSTGDAPKLNSTGLDLTANYAWTGVHSWQTSEMKLGDSDASNFYIFAGSNIAADRTVTWPALAGNDTVVLEAFAQTLTNKTISGGTFSGTIAGTPTFSGGISFSSGLTIAAGQKLNLDGVGDTYIIEGSANRLDFFTNGNVRLLIQDAAGYVAAVASNLFIDPTKRFYLDGGGDTYITEGAANRIDIYTGGTNRVLINNASNYFQILSSSLIIDSGQPIRLDGNGGGDTYISETVANTVVLRVGGVDQITATAATVIVDSEIFFNAGTGSNAIGASATALQFYVGGGSPLAELKSTGLEVAGTIATAASNDWGLGAYSAGAPAATGYVAITINGVAYKLLAST